MGLFNEKRLSIALQEIIKVSKGLERFLGKKNECIVSYFLIKAHFVIKTVYKTLSNLYNNYACFYTKKCYNYIISCIINGFNRFMVLSERYIFCYIRKFNTAFQLFINDYIYVNLKEYGHGAVNYITDAWIAFKILINDYVYYNIKIIFSYIWQYIENFYEGFLSHIIKRFYSYYDAIFSFIRSCVSEFYNTVSTFFNDNLKSSCQNPKKTVFVTV